MWVSNSGKAGDPIELFTSTNHDSNFRSYISDMRKSLNPLRVRTRDRTALFNAELLPLIQCDSNREMNERVGASQHRIHPRSCSLTNGLGSGSRYLDR